MSSDTSGSISLSALREQLRGELSKEHPDRPTVTRILEALKQHSVAEPDTVPPETQRALDALWQNYTSPQDSTAGTKIQKKASNQIIIKISAMAALLVLMICIAPAVVGISNLHKRFGHWNQKEFSFLSATQPTDSQENHAFETDHPGLKKIHEAMEQLGITEPVVPTWIPEEYQLVQLIPFSNPEGSWIFALLKYEDSTIALSVKPWSQSGSNIYLKDTTPVDTLEVSGTMHYIMRNNQEITAAWTANDLECSLSACGSYVDLKKILMSIYKEVT